jgi:hypothetical protein
VTIAILCRPRVNKALTGDLVMTVGKHVGLHNYCFANYAFDRESAATGWVDLDLPALGLEADHAFQVTIC